MLNFNIYPVPIYNAGSPQNIVEDRRISFSKMHHLQEMRVFWTNMTVDCSFMKTEALSSSVATLMSCRKILNSRSTANLVCVSMLPIGLNKIPSPKCMRMQRRAGRPFYTGSIQHAKLKVASTFCGVKLKKGDVPFRKQNDCVPRLALL